MPIPEPTMRFIDEPIEAQFDSPPLLEKSPPCPQGFIWQSQIFRIVELLAEWKDFRRRGRMGRNMIPPHLSRAERIGSWGVGRFFFRVRTEDGRIFEIYFDRAPADAGDRKGSWVLFGERLPHTPLL
ncbi:MAG: hypothetical protein D9V45_06405 [Chloroflexi bacterium]|nr:MAG: hypothetical protein D9V45_06405 [Chloroflexota bacterium]